MVYVDRDELRISPSVSWTNSDNLNFNLQYNYNVFLTDSLDLFNKPNSTLSLTGEQKLLKNKLTFSQDLHLIGERTHSAVNNFGMLPVQDLVVLPTYLDVGLGIKYRINDHVDISIRGVNLLQDNETVNLDSEVDYATEWLGYPILGRQFWGKLKLRF
jgi:outer membrane receptor for ferrienterochelin and colicin